MASGNISGLGFVARQARCYTTKALGRCKGGEREGTDREYVRGRSKKGETEGRDKEERREGRNRGTDKE